MKAKMEYFIKKLIDNAKKYPARKALVSYNKKVFTYADLDYYSAKVYAFLEEGELLFHKLEFSDVMCVVDIFEDVNSPKLTLGIHYSVGNYSSASMERFCKLFNDATHYLDGSSKKQKNQESN